MGRELRVMVVGDQPLTRAGIRALLDDDREIGAVHEAPDVLSAAVELRDGTTDVVVVVLGPRTPHGEPVKMIAERVRTVPILVVSGDLAQSAVRRAFADGALGFLPVTARVEELLEALRTVASRRSYLHPDLGAALAQAGGARPVDELSPRELEVLRLIALGYTNPEIARRLVVSVRTVETHRAHMSRKLRARTRADLVRQAIAGGLLSAELADTS